MADGELTDAVALREYFRPQHPPIAVGIEIERPMEIGGGEIPGGCDAVRAVLRHEQIVRADRVAVCEWRESQQAQGEPSGGTKPGS